MLEVKSCNSTASDLKELSLVAKLKQLSKQD